MNENYIEFRKIRNLGAILSDTISFLRNEWRPLFTVIFKASIIPIVIAIAAALYYNVESSSFVSGFDDDDIFYNSYDSTGSLLAAFMLIVAYILAYALISTSVFGYIKSYVENNGIVNFEKLDQFVKSKFPSYLGLSIISTIITGFGLLLCFLPGIYFGVVLSLSFCILIFHQRGVFDSIGDSFNFIKGHWWDTFGILLVVQILIFFGNLLFSVPMIIYELDSTGLFSTSEYNSMSNIFSDPIQLIYTIFSYILEFIFNIINLIVIAFIFFDIEEQKNPTTHSHIIDSIGSDNA